MMLNNTNKSNNSFNIHSKYFQAKNDKLTSLLRSVFKTFVSFGCFRICRDVYTFTQQIIFNYTCHPSCVIFVPSCKVFQFRYLFLAKRVKSSPTLPNFALPTQLSHRAPLGDLTSVYSLYNLILYFAVDVNRNHKIQHLLNLVNAG